MLFLNVVILRNARGECNKALLDRSNAYNHLSIRWKCTPLNIRFYLIVHIYSNVRNILRAKIYVLIYTFTFQQWNALQVDDSRQHILTRFVCVIDNRVDNGGHLSCHVSWTLTSHNLSCHDSWTLTSHMLIQVSLTGDRLLRVHGGRKEKPADNIW